MTRLNRRLFKSFLMLVVPLVSEAATILVDHTGDSGPGSLRQAILDSNASVGEFDTIAFDIPVPVAEPVSGYSAEGEANDSVEENDGVLENGATFEEGLIGQGFGFDGVDDQISIPHNSNQNTGAALAISAWIHPTSIGHGRSILQKRSPSNIGGYVFETTHPPFGQENGLAFGIWVGGSLHVLQTPLNVLTLGSWQHVAASYDGSMMWIFVNGEPQGSMPVSGPIDAVTAPIVIGRNVVNSTFAFHGLMDEIALFDSALSQSEGLFLYEMGVPSLSPLQTDFVSLHRAEGNANDSSGSHNGVLNNGATFVQGISGRAFSLDGVDDYVSIPHSDDLNPTGTFSVATWIKAATQQLGSDGLFLIVDKSHGWTDGTGWALQGESDGRVSFFYGIGGDSGTSSNFVGVTTHEGVLDDKWHHLVGVFTGSQFEIWLDGVLDNVEPNLAPYVGNSRDMEIGRSWGGGAPRRYFHGLIDEVAFFDQALSATDAISLFAAGRSSQSVVQTIEPLSPLPTITDPVNIDGYTQPGSAMNTNATGGLNAIVRIELDGSHAGSTNGLTIAAGNSLIQGLAINRFAQQGIYLQGAGGNTVQGNFIGTDAVGMEGRQNGFSGIYMDSPNNTIGGTTPGARNLSSGNFYHGIEISGGAATGNVLQGNLIGTNSEGKMAIPGTDTFGVFIDGAGDNVIGGSIPGAGNVISGNASHGIEVRNSSGIRIEGNFIGTDAHGIAALGNGGRGVNLSDSSQNMVGGTAPGARNLISGNMNSGVRILDEGSMGNLVRGNYIGVNVHGDAELGNGSDGLIINNADGNTVGGTEEGAGNLISGNKDDGLEIRNCDNNIIEGNRIGLDAAGTVSIGNTLNGVLIDRGSNNRIGGTEPGSGNLVTGNGQNGILVRDTSGGNSILMNSVFSNGALGIDLGEDGSTQNDVPPGSDPPDQDTGPNNLQNFPTLTSIGVSTLKSGEPTLQGNLQSVPNTSFRIEFFSSTECDPSGNGEGNHFLGSSEVSTDLTGSASINAILNVFLTEGEFVTATATRMDGPLVFGDTSEFSLCFKVNGERCPQPYPDFNEDERVDAIDMLMLLSGIEGNDLAFDLTEDALADEVDLLEFSLSWLRPDCAN